MKKTFVLALFLACSAAAICQIEVLTQSSPYPAAVTKTIIREFGFPATISYVETAGQHYFAFANQTMAITNCAIDPNIFVHDFVIFNNRVFFCGLDNSGGPKGVFGWFVVNDLMNGNLFYHTYQQFACNNESVDTLNSITAFTSLGSLHVVAVGTTNDGSGNANGCLIDMTEAQGAWNYTIGITPAVTGERFKHVCLTDNYVVASGPSKVGSGFETYRRHSKTNIFTPGGIEDDVWKFVSSNINNPGIRNVEQYSITHTTGDTIAAALQHCKNSIYSIVAYAHDMSSLVNAAVNYNHSFGVSTSATPIDVYGLKYDMLNKSLVLLLNCTYLTYPISGSGSIVAEIPVSFPASIHTHTLGGVKLTSLDLYNSQHNFLCQGTAFGLGGSTFAYTHTLGSSANCAVNSVFQGFQDPVMTKGNNWPYSLCSGSFVCQLHHPTASLKESNTIMCQF